MIGRGGALRRPGASARLTGSISELLAQDALVQAVARIE